MTILVTGTLAAVIFSLPQPLILAVPEYNRAAPASSFSVWSPREQQLLAGAAERIEHYRKGDAAIIVTDADGKPVPGAAVRVEMQRHEFLFGCNLFMLGRSGSPTLDEVYGSSFAGLFNYATLPFYWRQYEPTSGGEQRERLRVMADWASKRGIVTKGHPILWANSVPDWPPVDVDEFEKAAKTRVTRVVSDFCGLVSYWDVVNEPVTSVTFSNQMGRWMAVRSPSKATAMVLNWARDACSGALLLVNDFRVDDAFHKLLESIQADGGRFDAIGLQSHMHTADWKLDRVWDVCEKFEDLNVPLHFTEVTVLSGQPMTDNDWKSYRSNWNTTPDGESRQAEYVVAFYTILFSHPSVQAITWWDLSDRGAWLGAPAGLVRKDMTPKPAYERLKSLIKKDWWTTVDLVTDSRGAAHWRGFYGDYRLTVVSGPERAEALVKLTRAGTNQFEVRLPSMATALVSPPPKPELVTPPSLLSQLSGPSVPQESLPVRPLALVVGLVVALVAGVTLFVLTRVRKK